MGLFVGASLLTILEIFDYLYEVRGMQGAGCFLGWPWQGRQGLGVMALLSCYSLHLALFLPLRRSWRCHQAQQFPHGSRVGLAMDARQRCLRCCPVLATFGPGASGSHPEKVGVRTWFHPTPDGLLAAD